MSESFRIAIASICGFIVFLYLLITRVIQNKNKKTKLIELAKQNNCIVKGRCVETKRIQGTNNFDDPIHIREESMKVKYEYIVNNIKYYKKIKFQSIGSTSAKYPYEITIYYNKNNPKKCVSNHDSNTRGTGCLLTIVMTLLTFCLALNILKLF